MNYEEAVKTLKAFENPETHINEVERMLYEIAEVLQPSFKELDAVAKMTLAEKDRRPLTYNMNKTLDHFSEMQKSMASYTLALEAILVECEEVIEAEEN